MMTQFQIQTIFIMLHLNLLLKVLLISVLSVSGQAGTVGDGKNSEAWDRDYSQRSEETCDDQRGKTWVVRAVCQTSWGWSWRYFLRLLPGRWWQALCSCPAWC